MSNMIDGQKVAQALVEVANTIERNKDYLCALDSEVGDGDHGVSMTIGMRTARRTLMALQSPTPESAFRAVAEAFADEVGAASGALYEGGFAAAARAVANKAQVNTTEDWAAIFEAIAHEMQAIGKAELNDKTLIDAWLPAAQALRQAAIEGAPLAEGLRRATAAAKAGVENTKHLIPKRGRASRLGERARGYQDAGATSAYLIIEALERSLLADNM